MSEEELELLEQAMASSRRAVDLLELLWDRAKSYDKLTVEEVAKLKKAIDDRVVSVIRQQSKTREV